MTVMPAHKTGRMWQLPDFHRSQISQSQPYLISFVNTNVELMHKLRKLLFNFKYNIFSQREYIFSNNKL